jgi:hypothetical protein
MVGNAQAKYSECKCYFAIVPKLLRHPSDYKGNINFTNTRIDTLNTLETIFIKNVSIVLCRNYGTVTKDT